jgi:23S rRNA (guanosine2251-2'-O)-methyltransferase
MTKETQIFGVRAIIEAIKSGKDLDKIYIQKELSGNLIKELLQVIKQNDISYSYVPVEKLNKFGDKNHQGAVATIAPITFIDIDEMISAVLDSGKKPLFLVLDQLSDTRNFGAIIRTAECTGVNGIIIPKNGSAPINGDTVKTSAGAIFNIPIAKVAHTKDAIFHLQASGIKTVGATEKTTDSIYDIDFTEPTAIVMGNEEKGINPSVIKILDKKAKLPMFGTISSLNVSVACGAFLYEVVRQRIK